MLEVVAAVVRRVGMSPKFNARDFELVLSRPLSGEDLRFSLPSTIVKGAESTKAAAERLAGDTLGMKAIRSHRVCSRSSTNRSRDGRHAIAVSYFVLVDPGVEPSDLNGMKNSYFNLGEAIEEHRLYDFVRDHRELANTTLGWLRQMASSTPPRLDFVMQTQGRRKVRAVIQNPLMQKGLSSSLDVPVFTHNNGYFLSGVLKPENADGAIDRYNQPRQSISDLHGVVDLDVHDGDPGGYDRAHPSIRRRSAENEDADGYRAVGDEPLGTGPMELPTLPMVEREGYVGPGGVSARHGASVRSAGAMAVPTGQQIEPIYSQSTKKSARRKDATTAAVKPVLSDGDLDAVPTTTWFTQPDHYAEIADVLPAGGGGGGDGDDEVEAALNGLRTSIKKGAFSPAEPESDLTSPVSPDYSRQASKSSIVIPDTEHPFMDDLNGDFSNPLFRS